MARHERQSDWTASGRVAATRRNTGRSSGRRLSMRRSCTRNFVLNSDTLWCTITTCSMICSPQDSSSAYRVLELIFIIFSPLTR